MNNAIKYFLVVLLLFGLVRENYAQCTATSNFIFNGSSQYNFNCTNCDFHNDNAPSGTNPTCASSGPAGSNSGYTGLGTENDNNLLVNEFELTPNCTQQGGSFWNNIQLDLKNDFSIEAELFFGDIDRNGSDGIAFVLQTTSNPLSAVTTGGSIGYGNLSPSFAIEFDTYSNSNNSDPGNYTGSETHIDHLAVQLNGNLDHANAGDVGSDALITPIDLVNIEDGQWHLFRFEWVADPDSDPNTTDGQLDVWFDANDNGVFDTGLNNEHYIDAFSYDMISEVFSAEDGIVYWGFTAATGAARNWQKVRNINPIIQVDFNYSSSLYCKNESNPSPTVTGQSGGTFSSTAGLLFADVSSNIGSSTGEIDLANSTAGTYTIRYEIDATCFVEKVVTIEDYSPYFTYSSSVYCQSDSDPTPTHSSCLDWSFSSTSGLVINSTTGAIDLDASLPGTYTVRYSGLVEQQSLSWDAMRQCHTDNSPCSSCNGMCDQSFTTTSTANEGNYYAHVTGSYSSVGNHNSPEYIKDGAFRFRDNNGTVVTSPNNAFDWRWDSSSPLNTVTVDPNVYNPNHEYFLYFYSSPGGAHTISMSETQFSYYDDNYGVLNFDFYHYHDFTVTIVADPSNVSAGTDVSVCNGASVSLSGSGTCNGVGSIEEFFDQNSYGNSSTNFTNTPNGFWHNTTNGDSHDWFGDSDVTNTTSTGPCSPNSGDDYIYFETSSCCANSIGNNAILESNDLTNSNPISLQFFYHMHGANIGTLEVEYFDGTNWASIWKKSGQQHVNGHNNCPSAWNQASIDLTPYILQTLRIKATADGGVEGDIALDDIVIFTSTNNTCTYNWTTNAANGEIGWSYSSPTDVIVANNANSTHTGTYTFTVTDESGCSNTDDVLVNISDLDDASFDFDDFCINVNGGPSNVATTGGSFSFNPPVTDGATINSSSGVISNGVAGTSYIVEYLTNGTCPNSSTQTVSVLPMEDASFTYPNNSYCPNETDPEPTITGTLNGVFSSSVGLIFLDVNSNSGSLTGKVDLSASTPGTYSITYTTQGTCSVNSSQSLTINNSISWANLQWPPNGEICPSGSFDAYGQVYVPNVTPAVGAGSNIVAEIGYSTSNTNPNTWSNWATASFNVDVVNNDEYEGTLSGLSAGTYYYAFRYSIDNCDYIYGGFSYGSDPNSGAGGIWDGTTYTSGVLTVNSTDASFTYPQCCYFSTDTDPTPIPIVTGIQGTYSCANSGLSMSSDGTIDLSASLPGNYTIIHTLDNCPITATQDVLISNGNNCNSPTFTPLSHSNPNQPPQIVASHLGGNDYQLTTNTGSVRGAVWCDQPLNLDYSFTIQVELNFGNRTTSSGNDPGADGISFVLHQNYQPQPIGGIGYFGFDPSIAVEFDTYYNSNTVPPATVPIDDGAPNSIIIDHMAVQLDGVREHNSPNNILAPFSFNNLSTLTAGNIEDGQFHPVTFHWDVINTTFKIYFDNQLIGTVNRDIRNDFTGLVYWGFASSTGAAWNDHRFTYVNSNFWSGRNPTTLSDNINEWQGDITAPTETIIDPIDNSILHHTTSWFNPCNWSARFVPDYDTDVVIPHPPPPPNTNYHHPIVNYNTSIFSNHSVLYLDMDRDGDVDMDDQVQGKAFAKSLQMEGNALFFTKTDSGAEIQVKD